MRIIGLLIVLVAITSLIGFTDAFGDKNVSYPKGEYDYNHPAFKSKGSSSSGSYDYSQHREQIDQTDYYNDQSVIIWKTPNGIYSLELGDKALAYYQHRNNNYWDNNVKSKQLLQSNQLSWGNIQPKQTLIQQFDYDDSAKNYKIKSQYTSQWALKGWDIQPQQKQSWQDVQSQYTAKWALKGR